MVPVIIGRARRDAQGVGGFDVGHADKEAELYQLRFEGALDGQFVQSIIDRQHLLVVFGRRQFNIVNRDAFSSAAVA